jgi:polyvinyl alcohol dehydrogenase (cytochrome)
MYGLDLFNTRFARGEHQLTRRTVGRLAPNWMINGLVGVVGTPAVVDGVAYFGDWTGKAHAVDKRTGQELWQQQLGPSIVAAPAVAGRFVYMATGNTLFGLDRTTGAIRWKSVTNEDPFAQISASPIVVDGLVLQGTASFEVVINSPTYSFRGTIGAYDAGTGREVWRFTTTPNDATNGAGIGIWSTPAVDRHLGLLYVGTGQNLSPPAGPLEDSIIAIDYRTGALRWAHQFTTNDVFSGHYPGGHDFDFGASPNEWSARGRQLIGDGDKAGNYYALDRATGQVVWQTRLTPGGPFGGDIGSAAVVDGEIVVGANGAPGGAEVIALDQATGAVRWRHPLAGQIFAPVSAVHGVAFVGTSTGLMTALDTRDGTTLWSYQVPGPVACGPSIVDGQVLWGYGYTLFGPGTSGGLISFTMGDRR